MIPIGIQEQGGSEELDERVTAIENQEDMENVFVAMQNFSIAENILTIYLKWIWKLLGVTYSNPANVSFPIAYCAAGKSRFEYIVPNDENGFTRITGQETLGTAQAPQLPAHGLYVTFFLVTDSAIGIPKQPNIAKTPNIQEILDEGYSTTNIIWFYNNNNSNCLGISSERILFQKLESVFNQISADNTTESYNVQLPNKIGGAEETFAMVSDLEELGSIATTVKPILSTALATQNVAGFVTYINALNPVLVVGASEIVKYNLTDTGRVFELNLRGRSFGTGQPAIVAADVLEVTDFLNKDIKLSNYPSTRNDGQLPTNKVLAPDANGNVKLYSIAIAPAPWIKELIPDSYLPDTTGNIRILGDFFTPEMCNRITNPNAIIIGGVTTIHYANFISSQEILANVTTGSVEGNFSITLNNGLETVKANALLIVLGEVYTPEEADFTSIINPIMLEKGKVLTSIANAEGSAIWNKPFNTSLNFEVRLNHVASPFLNFGTSSNGAQPWFNTFELRRTDNNSIIAYGKSIGNQYIDFYNPNDPVNPEYAKARIGANSPYPLDTFPTLRIKYVQGIFYFFTNNILIYTFPNDGNRNLTTNVYIKFIVGKCDVSNIKYIELAS